VPAAHFALLDMPPVQPFQNVILACHRRSLDASRIVALR
jgi:hypothetical protein